MNGGFLYKREQVLYGKTRFDLWREDMCKFSISFKRNDSVPHRPYHPSFEGSKSAVRDLDERIWNARTGSPENNPVVVIVEARDLEDAYRIAERLGSSFAKPIVMPYLGDKPGMSEEEFLATHLLQTAPA